MPLSLSLYTAGNTCCMGVCPIVSCRGCSRAAHRVTDEQTKDFLIVCPSGHERFFRWIGTFHSSLRSWYPLRGNYSQSNSCGAGFSIFRTSLIPLGEFIMRRNDVSFFTFLFYIVINDAKIFNFLASLLREIFFSFISFEDSFALLIFRSFQNHWTKF